MEKQNQTHRAMLRPDKSIFAPEIRTKMVGDVVTPNGHHYENREFYYYPDEVFQEEDENGEKIFFVPAISLHKAKSERVVIPIFMFDFRPVQRTEIISYGVVNGLEIGIKYFFKPQIAITYNERLELEPNELPDSEDED